MRRQRGEVILVVLALTAVIGLGVSVASLPIGRYAAVAHDGVIWRMDTSTGAMEQCKPNGSVLACTPIEAKKPPAQ
jgi:hypothetical protein